MSAESDQRQADLERAEREMQRYLGGDSPLSEKYRAQSHETTPPQLDSAVLAHAQEQLQSAFVMHRSHALRRRHRRWAIPLATAATMLVGVNLVWQLRDQAVPAVAPTVSVDRDMRSAPAGSAQDMAVVPQQVEKAKRYAESERQQQAGREPARHAPAEAPAVSEMLSATEAPQPEPADAAGEPAAKKERAKVDEARAEEGAARLQHDSRVDAVMAQRERKAMAASGFASAMQRAPAPAAAPEPVEADDVEPSAHDVAQTLLIWLRMGDFASIRNQLDAMALDDQMLLAAATAAKSMDRDLEPEISDSGDGLWRIDYRDGSKSLRCTAMLQLTSAGWTLLRIDVE